MLGSIMPAVFVACQRMLPNSETIINSFLPLIWRNLAVYRLPKKGGALTPKLDLPLTVGYIRYL